jgi:hypothetical protein
VVIQRDADVEDEALPDLRDAQRLDVVAGRHHQGHDEHTDRQAGEEVATAFGEDLVDDGAGNQRRQHRKHRQQHGQRHQSQQADAIGVRKGENLGEVMPALAHAPAAPAALRCRC